MDINIGLSAADRHKSVELLNTFLADEVLLTVKTRKYHWNVSGMDFIQLHKFLEEQYKIIDDVIDRIAERVRALGGKALGGLEEFLQKTRLKELTGQIPDTEQMLGDLLANHEAIIAYLRQGLDVSAEQYHDAGTSDFLTGLMEKHEKMAWMLRAHLE